MDKDLFKNDPRGYAIDLVESGMVSTDTMIIALLKWMSCDDVREALDANELSPRFDDEDDESEDA